MLPQFLNWLDMTADQAQALSKISMVLFVITIIVIVIGILFKLRPRLLHWLALLGFSACLMMGALTSMLYFWHHYLRK